MLPLTDGWPPLLLALLFGLKHALDADHLAAVSTIVNQRKSLWSSSLVGLAWGAGHMLALLAAALLVVTLQLQIPPQLALALELVVALVLIAVGVEALWKLRHGGRVHVHLHTHAGHVHWHPHVHAPEVAPQAHSHHGLGFARRPLLIGMLHGLAGSAALMLLIVAQTSSVVFGLLYVVVFGVGSVGGMVAMSLLLSLPLQMVGERYARLHTTVRALAALFSLSVGLSMAYEIGVGGGLFL